MEQPGPEGGIVSLSETRKSYTHMQFNCIISIVYRCIRRRDFCACDPPVTRRERPRSCPPGRVLGRLRVLGHTIRPCYVASIAPPWATGGANEHLSSTAGIRRRAR